jgi:hypothetical protein
MTCCVAQNCGAKAGRTEGAQGGMQMPATEMERRWRSQQSSRVVQPLLHEKMLESCIKVQASLWHGLMCWCTI